MYTYIWQYNTSYSIAIHNGFPYSRNSRNIVTKKQENQKIQIKPTVNKYMYVPN